jgi:uncharacterized protein (TIGR02246 family)
MKTRIRIPARFVRRLACLMVLPLTVAWLACAPAAETGEDAAMEPMATAAGVEAAFQAFVDVWEAEDVEAVLATFTADAVVFDPVPPGKFSGSEGIRGLVTSTFESQDGISIPVSEVEVRTHGPVAWSTARYTYQADMGGETIADEGYVSMVWVLQDDGSYRATLFHASPLPVEPMAGAS